MCASSKKYGFKKDLGKSKIQSTPHDFNAFGRDQNYSPRRRHGRSCRAIAQLPNGQSLYGLEDDHYIVKVQLKEAQNGLRFHQLMDQSEVKTLLHKRDKEILFSIDPNMILQTNDILVVEGLLEPLRRLAKHFKTE